MPEDWSGNRASTFKCLGASSHCNHEREERDYYATDPIAAELLLEVEPELNNIWENACGQMSLANVFEKHGKLGRASDIINRDNDSRIEVKDFLDDSGEVGLFSTVDNEKDLWDGDIVTNPPYKEALAFVKKSLKTVKQGRKVCMFLKLTFLEGKERKEFYKENPPKVIYVCSGRITCAMNGEFEKLNPKTKRIEKQSSAVCYAWFVWEKGFKGDPIIKWIN